MFRSLGVFRSFTSLHADIFAGSRVQLQLCWSHYKSAPFQRRPRHMHRVVSLLCNVEHKSKSWDINWALELTSWKVLSNAVQEVGLFLILSTKHKLIFCLSNCRHTIWRGEWDFEVRHFAFSRKSLCQENQNVPVPLPSSRSELIATSKDSLGVVSFPSFWKNEKSSHINNISVINTTQWFC